MARKVNKIVYDLKGYTYVWEGKKCEEGFIVYPIYPGSLFWNGHDVEQEEDSMGDPIILKQIYEDRPTHKLDEQIKELQDKIQSLQGEINNKRKELNEIKEEIDLINRTPAKDLLLDKVSTIKNADVLVKALTKEVYLYGVNPDNVPYSTQYGVIGVNLHDGKILYLYQEESYSNKYINEDLSNTKFKTLEEAEKYALNQINKQYSNKPKYISDVRKIDALFDKYNVQRTWEWTKHYNKIKEEVIAETKMDIKRKEQRIKDTEQEIEKLKEKLNSY